ncbi:IS4 family transposase [Sporosarcina sp. Marseille-Q4063]|uniref:IS4 family transposase n=1 Tax=Sporosarcina sp. Marseille-Q4063 TaxID=2810514 RepID=UPI001BAEB148|nr:IS4 family transposase [Sporosarcina sp. Marseille-Q4063]QUW21859.1 IS4 family transposase [Sporosarcina sp. Marseille-Q4063]QUW22703.1 IS4 family transposase [Sporosarcina sp. Marseille-Q4063]QUW23661.1 IS4 family transposase [Sporosarcina sp. Marseille-Q4063]
MIFCRPIELSKIAKDTKFIQRNRQLSVIKFLEILFAEPGNIAKKSLTELCLGLSHVGVTMSKQGFDKKFNENSVAFLKAVFLALFTIQMKLSIDKTTINSTIDFNTVRILDGTSIKLTKKLQFFYPGTVDAGAKCQIEFDYLTGRFIYMEIQAGKAGDSASGIKRLESLQKNDLILQDLGYFQYKIFEKVDGKQAFYVSRAPADTMFYVDHPNPRYHKDGKIMKMYAYERLYLEEELKTMKRGTIREYPKVYLGKQAKYPTRLVIYRMTHEQEQRQEERIKRRGQTKPGKIKKKSYDVSSISVYVTNLPQKVPAEEVPQLYRYRWQVELVFKSWKSDMEVDFYRNMKKERWECHFYAELILLLLSLLITYQLRVYFKEERDIILSEQITMCEVSKRIWKIWQARDQLEWENLINELIKGLARLGRKNIKKIKPRTDQQQK